MKLIRKMLGVKQFAFTCTSGYKGDMSIVCVVTARNYEQAKFKLHKRLEKCGISLVGNYLLESEVI